MNRTDRIYVAGHRGMVGAALVRRLKAAGYTHIVTRSHGELDLTDQPAVNDFFVAEKIDVVLLAAAKVGGIHANSTYPADFIYQNLMIQTNVIHSAWRAGIQRLLFLGSSCIYPRACPQPMREEHLLSGHLEPTNAPYAIAKIAGITQCRSYNRQYGTDYRAVMPTNLYGPDDNFDLRSAHVLPALLRKFHLARLASQQQFDAIERDEAHFGRIPDDIRKTLFRGSDSPEVLLWGTGMPKREFLHADDMADACIFVMNLPQAKLDQVLVRTNGNDDLQKQNPGHINVGWGRDITIRRLAERIKAVVGFDGAIRWDPSKPDGTPQKRLDTTRLNTAGWRPRIELEDGLERVYAWYRDQTRSD